MKIISTLLSEDLVNAIKKLRTTKSNKDFLFLKENFKMLLAGVYRNSFGFAKDNKELFNKFLEQEFYEILVSPTLKIDEVDSQQIINYIKKALTLRVNKKDFYEYLGEELEEPEEKEKTQKELLKELDNDDDEEDQKNKDFKIKLEPFDEKIFFDDKSLESEYEKKELKKIMIEELKKELADKSPKLREIYLKVLELHFFNDQHYTLSQIAQKLNLNERNVRNYLEIIRKILKSKYEKFYSFNRRVKKVANLILKCYIN